MGRIKFKYDEDKMEKIIEYNTSSVMEALEKFNRDFNRRESAPTIKHMDVMDRNWKEQE